MTNITKAAQDFFNTDNGATALLPETPGVEYLDIDIVDFTGLDVANLFDDKYVAVYIIKDTEPQSDEDIKDMYYLRGVSTSLFYPDHIQDKLQAHYGEQLQYMNNSIGKLISVFDYDLLSDEDKTQYVVYDDKTTNYHANTAAACEKMWEPLTSDEIDELVVYTKGVVDENLEQLLRMETSVERPYAVNVFNDSIASFMCSYATYEECTQLLERIHVGKIKTVSSEMAFI